MWSAAKRRQGWYGKCDGKRGGVLLGSITRTIGWTWPWNPVVPDSMRGTSAARHIRLTCLRASSISIPIPPRTGTEIIKSIKNNIKSVEKFKIKLWILDIGMSRLQEHPRIEPLRNFPGHLQRRNKQDQPIDSGRVCVPKPLTF